MNAAIHQYVSAQRQADLVREARRAELRPSKPKLEAVEQPRRHWLRLLQASRSAA
jgi:hypothetical protein